jgi:DnaK suppressor protein
MSTVMIKQTSATRAEATTWETSRLQLQQQRAVSVRQRELALAETATSVPDPVAVRRAAGLALRIDEIDTALDRIADGTFGRCAHCGLDIPVERLEVRPFATGCVVCQVSAR